MRLNGSWEDKGTGDERRGWGRVKKRPGSSAGCRVLVLTCITDVMCHSYGVHRAKRHKSGMTFTVLKWNLRHEDPFWLMADKLFPDVSKCSLPNPAILLWSNWRINISVSACFTNTMQAFSSHYFTYSTVSCTAAWWKRFCRHEGPWMRGRLGLGWVWMVWESTCGVAWGILPSSLNASSHE